MKNEIILILVFIPKALLQTCLLSIKPLIPYATLFNRYSDIIYSNKGRGLKFIQVTLSNCPGRGGQTPG